MIYFERKGLEHFDKLLRKYSFGKKNRFFGVLLVEKHSTTTEYVVTTGSDIGGNAQGTPFKSFAYIKVWIAPEIEANGQSVYFQMSATQRKGREWIEFELCTPADLNDFEPVSI